jgi:hypothetical protein
MSEARVEGSGEAVERPCDSGFVFVGGVVESPFCNRRRTVAVRRRRKGVGINNKLDGGVCPTRGGEVAWPPGPRRFRGR